MAPISIIRLKRKRTSEVADSIILSCKKSRVDGKPIDEIIKPLFKFAATINKKEDNFSDEVKRAIRKEKLARDVKTHSTAGWTADNRDILRQSLINKKSQTLPSVSNRVTTAISQNNRFRLVCEKRSDTLDTIDIMNDSDDDDGKTTCSSRLIKNCQLFDIDTAEDRVPNYAAHAKTEGITCNGEEMECVDYVYDVYYMNDTDVNINNMQQISSVMPIYENDYLYEKLTDEDGGEGFVYSSDENDEDNWRNDYPDEDPHFIENGDCEYTYGDDGAKYEDYGVDDLTEQMSELNPTSSRCMSYQDFKNKVLKDL